MKTNKITFFGHRDTSDKLYNKIKLTIKTALSNDCLNECYIGNDGNFDRLCTKALTELKAEFNIKIILVFAYLPTPSFEVNVVYNSSIYPEGLELAPKRLAILKRNEYMIKSSHCIIFHSKLNFGGTYNALKLAIKLDKKYLLIE